MFKIITTKQLQQKIGEVSVSVSERAYVVTNRGEGRIVLLPYFEGCDEMIEDYMEDYEIMKNKERLDEKWAKSLASGNSDLTI